MFVHKTFTIITNLFGLNVYEQEVPLSLILIFNLLIWNLQGAINIYYAIVTSNPKLKLVYVAVDFVQLIWPLIYKNLIFVMSIYMKDFDEKFDEKVRKVYKPWQIKKNQKNFFVFIVVSALISSMKIAFQHSVNQYIYNFSSYFLTIVNATSDFIFVYHVLCLKDYVKLINETYAKSDVAEETLNIIEIKRLIHLRYSKSLAFAISHDFFLITVSLYWIFVRIAFGYLNNLEGKLSF